MKRFISIVLMLTVALSLAIAPISVSYARQYHNPNSQLTKASDGRKRKRKASSRIKADITFKI